MAKIDDFEATLKGGLRPNRFRLLLTLPSGISGDTRALSLMVKSTNTPTMETGIVEVNYHGKQRKLSGDERPAGDWTSTVYLNRDGDVATAKKIAEQWQKLSANTKDTTVFKATGYLEMLSPEEDSEDVLLKWEVEGVWCSTTGELAFSMEDVDTLAEFDLILNYDNVIPLH